MKEKSFRVYIFRLLKTVHSDLHITKSAVEAMDSVIRVVADRIMDRALILTNGGSKKTVSDNEIETTVNMIFPQSLAKNAVNFAKVAVNCFEYSETTKREEKEKEKEKENKKREAQTRESRCGLIFSVSASEKYARRFGQVGFHVSANTPIYLASVLEFLARQLLLLSGAITQNNNKITITVRHLFLAVSNNLELATFVGNLGIVFLNSGVEPQLVQNKPRPRVNRSKSKTVSESATSEESTTSKRSHRWRPGTKTVMQIRRLQKSSELLMQHAPFNRVVREIVDHIGSKSVKVRFTGEFFISLQSYCEVRLIELMKQANMIAVHAGRETVYDHDVQLVCSLQCVNTSFHHGPYTAIIPEAALRQMALRAGVKRYGDSSTESYRNYLYSLLELCLLDVVLCARHHDVQTMNAKLLLEALGMRGVYPTITFHKRKLGKKTASRANSKPAMEEPELSDVEEELAN